MKLETARLIKASEARNQLSQIIKSGETVEVQHPHHCVIILPKAKWESIIEQCQQLEKDLLNLEMDIAEANVEQWFTTKEVEAMLHQVRRKKKPYGKVDQASSKLSSLTSG